MPLGQPLVERLASQRAQYSLIKEHALNHFRGPYIIEGIVLNEGVSGSLGSFIVDHRFRFGLEQSSPTALQVIPAPVNYPWLPRALNSGMVLQIDIDIDIDMNFIRDVGV